MRRPRLKKIKRIPFRKKYFKYVLFGLGMYVLFLIISFPASIVFGYVEKYPALSRQLKLSSVQGSIWAGQARQVRIAGIQFGHISWQLQTLPLLWGTVSIKINFSDADAKGYGKLAITLGGNILVEDMKVSMPIEKLAPVMYGMPVTFSGEMNALVEEMELVKGNRINVKGRVVIAKAGMAAPQRIEYGDIVLKLSPDSSGSKIILADQGGPLILNGNINLKGNGRYVIDMKLGARENASKELVTGLRFMGRRDESGIYHYTSNGKINSW